MSRYDAALRYEVQADESFKEEMNAILLAGTTTMHEGYFFLCMVGQKDRPQKLEKERATELKAAKQNLADGKICWQIMRLYEKAASGMPLN